MTPVEKNVPVLALTLVLLFGGFSSAQATSPASEFRHFVFWVCGCVRVLDSSFNLICFNFCASICICELIKAHFLQRLLMGFSQMLSLS